MSVEIFQKYVDEFDYKLKCINSSIAYFQAEIDTLNEEKVIVQERRDSAAELVKKAGELS